MPTSRYHPSPKQLLSLLILCLLLRPVQGASPKSAPDLLTYDELVELYERDNPSQQLQAKLQKLLTSPSVNNEAFAAGTRPLKPHSPSLGRYLRIAHWNIERGIEYERVESVLKDPSRFLSLIDQAGIPSGQSQEGDSHGAGGIVAAG